MARPIVLILHLFWLADTIKFRKQYLTLVRRLNLRSDEIGQRERFKETRKDVAKSLPRAIGRMWHGHGKLRQRREMPVVNGEEKKKTAASED